VLKGGQEGEEALRMLEGKRVLLAMKGGRRVFCNGVQPVVYQGDDAQLVKQVGGEVLLLDMPRSEVGV
jgi:hypothetical protein